MIRQAVMADIIALCELLKWAHGESLYAEYPVEAEDLREFVRWAVSNNGKKIAAGTLFWVAESDGVLTGLILGAKTPVYGCARWLRASDVFFFGRRGLADVMDMAALFRRFITWASEDQRVVEIKVSSSDAMMPEIAGQPCWKDMRNYYLRRGFELGGEVFVRRFKR